MRRRQFCILLLISVIISLFFLFISISTRRATSSDPSISILKIQREEIGRLVNKIEEEVSLQAHESYNLLAKVRLKVEADEKKKKETLVVVTETKKLENDRLIEQQQGEVNSIEHEEEDTDVKKLNKDENGAHEVSGEELEPVIAVLVFACNRPSVTRCLDNLLRHRPSPKQFPIVLSQDCGKSPETITALQPYENRITHIFQPDLSEIQLMPKDRKYAGYYKIARHYGWALNYTFNQLKYSNVIIVEDDLEIAPDFFEYFTGTLPLLKADSSLWCISAWNDNGKSSRIDYRKTQLLHRTDFFPGLGWMLTKKIWNELSPKWPKGFWDDWMREPNQRKNRVCIRPEISRTKMSVYGKVGVSHGTYYSNHLQHIVLNDGFVPFSKIDLSYLLQENYDAQFLKKVYSAQIIHSFPELAQLTENENDETEDRLTYRTNAEFSKIAAKLQIMDDTKAGVPRTAYRGVVGIMYNNHRVYIAPGANWTGYKPS